MYEVLTFTHEQSFGLDRYKLEGLEFDCRQKAKYFLFSRTVYLGSGVRPVSYCMGTGVLAPGES
jgi:hypothetical protein